MWSLKVPAPVVVVILAVCAVVLNSQIYRRSKPFMELQGLAAHVDEEGRRLLVVAAREDGESRMSFTLTRDTLFLSTSDTSEDEPIDLEDICRGDRVRVRYELRDGRQLALSVIVE
jgi:hypothetical protein